MNSQDISLENKPPLQKDNNEENKREIKKTTDNNTVDIKKAEFLGTISRMEANEELQRR